MLNKALEIGLVDAPNERSSHVENIPKGGGAVFAVIFTLFNLYLYLQEPNFKPIVVSLLISGPALFALGWLDDRLRLSATVRLFVHFLVAGFAIFSLTHGFSQDFTVLFLPHILWINIVFCLLYLVWFINLYNFMDGVDGIAGGVGIVAAFALSFICYQRLETELLAGMYYVLGCSIVGFLFFNWSPAKLFMGDSGAYFLGINFAVLSLIGKIQWDLSLYPTIIIFGLFITDATFTLLTRVLRKQNPYKPHQQFGFHKLIKKGWGHGRAATLYISITLFWLFPLAYLSLQFETYGVGLVILSYIPLIAFEVYIKAGRG